MTEQHIRMCIACNIPKSADNFRAYNAYYSCKKCRDCENAERRKRKPIQNAIKQPLVPDHQSSAMEMICRAASLASAACDVKIAVDHRKCRDCKITKPITNFQIVNKAHRRSPICRHCEERARNHKGKSNLSASAHINKPTSQKDAIIKTKTCADCSITKPSSEFYRHGSDAKCSECRLKYNERSRNGELKNPQPPKRQKIDDLVDRVCQDVQLAQERVDAILQTPIVPRTCGRTPSPTSADPSQDHTSNHSDSGLSMRLYPGDATESLPIQRQKSWTQRGLEKFDQIELIGIIAKVFHINIAGLQCVYPDEPIADLGLWKTQVRELYNMQNPDMDDEYRYIAFDYVQAARDLKNEATLRFMRPA